MPITAVVTREHHLSRPGQTRHASTQAEVVPSAEISPTPLELDGSSLMNLPEQIGYLHAMGLDYGWGPTSAMQWVLEHVHVYGGLPWWGSIALTAVLIRVAIFKPSLTASEHSAKMAELRKNPRYNQIAETMQRATFEPGLKIDTMALRNEMRMMNKAAGLQLWRTFVPLVNLPIGIGMFRLLRGMAALPIPGLEHGGFLWFTDLTVADPLFILPLASAGVMFYIMKLNLPFVPPQNRAMMKGIAYVLTPLSLVVTLSLPAGLQWFFLVSAFLQFLQSWLYKQPWLRRWANLGPLPQTVEPRPNPPPYTQPSAGKWVAPRTISTTSRPAAPNAGDENMTMAGFVSGIRDGWKSAKTRMNNYTERSGKKEDGRKAQEYEQKRTLEEQEKFYARREARSEKKRKL